jgi:hypothetical protein
VLTTCKQCRRRTVPRPGTSRSSVPRPRSRLGWFLSSELYGSIALASGLPSLLLIRVKDIAIARGR